MNFESVVRPFAAETISPAARTLSDVVAPGVIACSLGGAGGRTVSWSFSNTGSVVPSKTERYRESSRSSVKRKVENPDDPSQFVEFCQATKINLSPDKEVGTPRTSTFDQSGGYHDLGNGDSSSQRAGREYTFNAPESKTCKENDGPPERGCGG